MSRVRVGSCTSATQAGHTMNDINPLKVLGRVIRDALDPSANDYQGEARAVVAAIRADTEQGAALRVAVLGLSAENPALWDRLDETAPTSAQMIEWHAPQTAALLRQTPACQGELRPTVHSKSVHAGRDTHDHYGWLADYGQPS
jgi:hypothetical protein